MFFWLVPKSINKLNYNQKAGISPSKWPPSVLTSRCQFFQTKLPWFEPQAKLCATHTQMNKNKTEEIKIKIKIKFNLLAGQSSNPHTVSTKKNTHWHTRFLCPSPLPTLRKTPKKLRDTSRKGRLLWNTEGSDTLDFKLHTFLINCWLRCEKRRNF